MCIDIVIHARIQNECIQNEPNLQTYRLFNLLIINIESDVVLTIIHTHRVFFVPQVFNFLEVLIFEPDDLGVQGYAFGPVALGDNAGASLEGPREEDLRRKYLISLSHLNDLCS